MKSFIVFAAVVACACAAPGVVLYSSPYYAAGPAVISAPAVVAPAVTSHQHHAQDELGQYTYGYAGGPSAKTEVKTLDGVTRGGYSYVDANGLVQSANYISDPINGFRVAATNLPVAPLAQAAIVPGPIPVQVQDEPVVAAAKLEHARLHAAAAAAAAAAPDN